MNTAKSVRSAFSIFALVIMMCALSGKVGAAPLADTIQIQKNSVSKAHRISLYPDANQKVVFFSVRGSEGKVYQLYMFDIEGRLVKQTETRNKQTTVIKGIDKGIYLFEVFSDDTRIGNGRIAVK
jgi:hypothetical protein